MLSTNASAMPMPFDVWLGTLRQTCGHFDCRLRNRRTFQGSVSTRTNGGIDIANIVTNAEKVTSSHAQRHDEDHQPGTAVVAHHALHAGVWPDYRILTKMIDG